MQRSMRGQTGVEFALTAGITVTLLFLIMNCCLALYAYSFVSYAAREGSRYAAVHGASNPSPAQVSDVTNIVAREAYGLNLDNLSVNTTWSPDNQPGSVVSVRVRYVFSFMVPFVHLSSVNLSSSSQMMISY